MKVTKFEIELLKAIVNSEFQDGQDPIGYPVWSFSCNPWEDEKPRRVSGVMSSLNKKGLAKSQADYDKSQNICWITEEGMAVLTANR